MAKNKSNSVVVATPKTNSKVKIYEPKVKVTRSIELNPKNAILTDKFRGRSVAVADEELIVMAESLRERQTQPIQVREVKDNPEMYEVIFGNTRTGAALKVQEGYTLPQREGSSAKPVVREAIPSFTLRAEVVEVEDEEAILRNITENAQRVATSDIDDAVNQEMLRSEYGMSDAAITRLYGYGHQASVTQLKKLLLLPTDVQQKIHRGDMTKQAGFVLVDWAKKKELLDAEGKVTEATADLILSKVTGGEDIGNVGSTSVVECIKAYEKEQKVANAPATPESNGEVTGAVTGTDTGTGRDANNNPIEEPKKSTFALTLKDVKDTLMEFQGLPDVSAKTAEFCATTLSFLKGEIEKDAFYDWVSVNLQ